MTSGRAALFPGRFDPSLPENAAKFTALEQLVAVADDLDCTLPELAVAFPLAHPAVTSVITGPRTMAQLECCGRRVDAPGAGGRSPAPQGDRRPRGGLTLSLSELIRLDIAVVY
jgi:hypothetical protein